MPLSLAVVDADPCILEGMQSQPAGLHVEIQVDVIDGGPPGHAGATAFVHQVFAPHSRGAA